MCLSVIHFFLSFLQSLVYLCPRLSILLYLLFMYFCLCPIYLCHCFAVYCPSLSLSFIYLISVYILFIFSCPHCLTPSLYAYHSHSIFISLILVISYFMVSFCPFISFQGLSNFFPFSSSVSHFLI